MKTSLFDFTLPESRIAAAPANPRDAARMLVVGPVLQDRGVRDFPSFLRPNDIVVFNDTRVIPARLLGRRGEAKVEILLHKRSPQVAGEQWRCFAKPAKRLKVGDVVNFGTDFAATVLEKCEDGQVILEFDSEEFHQKIQAYGQMPLPPYIEKQRKADASDHASYQTIYAQYDGSVAAPTAGLHFTPELLAALPCPRAHVTLHVGGGTFLPVKAEDTSEHRMHSEWVELSAETAAAINAAKACGGRVIAVGTTSLRSLESASDDAGIVHPFEGDTDIFITPGYQFKCVDMLLTNFHLPRSTLFMLVCAFSGLERMQAAYAHAIREDYRFYSYGDACLLTRNDR